MAALFFIQAILQLRSNAWDNRYLLAVPSMSRSNRKKIVDELKQFSVHVQTLPQMQDIVAGKVTIADFVK